MTPTQLDLKLFRVVENGELDSIRQLVTDGANVNCKSNDPDAHTPLIRAILAKQISSVQLLIQLGANVNLPQGGSAKWTPLMFAHTNPEMITELAAAGANPNWRTPEISGLRANRVPGQTALHLAAAANNPQAVRALINAGANVESIASDGATPLDYALRLGSMSEAAFALVEAGAILTEARISLMHGMAYDPDRDLAGIANGSKPQEKVSLQHDSPIPAPKPTKLPSVREFHQRSRFPLALYMVLGLMLFLAVAVILSALGQVPFTKVASPLLVGWVLFSSFMAWKEASPFCPNCHKNIKFCSALYCHVCGDRLQAKECRGCRVYQSWHFIFKPIWQYPGNRSRIHYCPSCSAWLDSNMHRFLGGGSRQ
jgi:ankyrin repeat protein